jgi:putative phosphoribosyl transferase
MGDGNRIFRDRRDAGIQLADKLKGYKHSGEAIVLALPRGGVVTGFEIARVLDLPMDVLIVRKIGFPGQSEFGIGAVSETGTVVLNSAIISSHGVEDEYIQIEIARQKEEVERRIRIYRKGKRILDLEGKKIILVDDGVATGATLKAAISALKKEKIKGLIAAIPVSPPETAEELKGMVDEFICLNTPADFMAVGNYYDHFQQVPDQTVVEILEKSFTPNKKES